MIFVQRVGGLAALGMVMLAGCGLSAPSAQAGYVLTLTQQGSNVIASGSGALDLTGLSLNSAGDTVQAGMNPAFALINTGPTSATTVDLYNGITGPTSFGSGFFTPASNGSGDAVAIQGFDDILIVPGGYVSGSLSDTATYNGQTLAGLGVTPGTYEWTWGTGPNQNFTLIIGAAAVPEPSSFLALGVALAGLLLLARTDHRSLGPTMS